MTNSQLLKDPLFVIPKRRDVDNFIEYQNKILGEYLVLVYKFENEEGFNIKEQISLIESFCENIIQATEKYYEGYPSDAYVILKKGLDSVKSHLMIWNKTPQNPVVQYPPQKINLYRIRSGGNNMYSKKELIHIPFDKREIV